MAYAELNAAEVVVLAQKAVETWTNAYAGTASAANRDGLAIAKRVLALANLAKSMPSGPKSVTLTDLDCLALVDAPDADAAAAAPGSVRAGFIGA